MVQFQFGTLDFNLNKLKKLLIFKKFIKIIFIHYIKNRNYTITNVLFKPFLINNKVHFLSKNFSIWLQSIKISDYFNFNLKYLPKLYALRLKNFNFFKNNIYYTNNFVLLYILILFFKINNIKFKELFLIHLLSYRNYPVKKNYFTKNLYKYVDIYNNSTKHINNIIKNFKTLHISSISYNSFFLNKFFFVLNNLKKSSVLGYFKIFNFLKIKINLAEYDEISNLCYNKNEFSVNSNFFKIKTNYFKFNILNIVNSFNNNNYVYFQVFNNTFLLLFKYIYTIFTQYSNNLNISIFELSLKFSFLLWAKNAITFTTYLDYLFFKLNKVEHAKLINLFNSFVEDNFLQILKLVNIYGFYMRFKGKITSFAGGRKKLYIIKYGKYSRSSRLFKIHFFQKNTNNLTGAVGINISISYM